MNRIPRHFHFVFGLRPQTEPFHLAHYLALASCLRHNRPERLSFHYRHLPYGRYWDLIRHHLELCPVGPPRALPVPSRPQDPLILHYSYAHEADFVRLEQLLVHGGVYADMDTLFVRPVPEDLFAQSCVLAPEPRVVDPATGEAHDSLCNAFIMAAPGSPFIRRWLEAMAAAFDGSWSAHSCQLPARLARDFPAEIHLAPSRLFYPYLWNRPDLTALFQKSRTVPADTCSIHLWAHLWWEPQRHDFCTFNHELLTERHVRRQSTTFARLARPDLPAPDDRPQSARWIDAGKDLWLTAWGRRHHPRLPWDRLVSHLRTVRRRARSAKNQRC